MSITMERHRLDRSVPPEPPEERPDPAEERLLDVYAVLGVTPDATPALARQMYWARMERLQQAAERNEPGAAAAIDDLNAALSIVLDDRRRAEYDRACRRSGLAATAASPQIERALRTRVGAVLALMLVTIGAALIAAWLGRPLVLAGAIAAGMLAVITIVAWPRRDSVEGRSPFTLLGVTEEASAQEVDLAYETLVQELLARVKYDPAMIRRLELLDRAYLGAVRLMAERAGEAVPTRRSFPARLGLAAVRVLFGPFALMVSALGSLALFVLLWLARVAARAALATGRRLRLTSARGVRFTAGHLSVLSRHIQGGVEYDDEEMADVSIDIDRRLAVGLRTVAERAAAPAADSEPEASRRGDEPAREPELMEAYLVLEASVGRRMVPIGTAPIRIGSGDECDLALAAHLGVASEHALVWQREGMLLMHVIAPRAGACTVNGQPMTWASLEDGDEILLGEARISVQAAQPAEVSR